MNVLKDYEKGVILTLLTILFNCFQLQAQVSDFTNLNFSKADSIAGLYDDHPITDLRDLSHKLTGKLSSDVDKFRAIYKWICENIDNDYGFYAKNKSMREKLIDQPDQMKEWNRTFHPKVFDKLVKEHKTICTGYAYLMKELAYFADIECQMIDGYGRTARSNIGGKGIPNHSWNAVKLDDKWYLCDATWSSGSVDPQAAVYLKNFSEAYFLTEPSLFVQNHYPLDTNWLLMNEGPTLDDFLTRPLVYKGALSHKINPESPATINATTKKGAVLTFRFETSEDLTSSKSKLEIAQFNSSFTKTPDLYRDTNGSYCIDYTFKSRGSYDVHLKLGDQYILSYAIEVIK